MGSTIVEITNIGKHGLWLLFNDKEYFLPFDKFPWFKKAAIEEIFKVKSTFGKNLYWSELDIDLSIDIIENPDKYPNISQK